MTLRGPMTKRRRILNKVNRSIERTRGEMKGRNPSKAEQTHILKIVELGCVVCLLEQGVSTPAEVHHIDGKTKPGAHLKSIPLCYLHHREGSDNEAYTSRHPYKARFEERYGTEQYLLDKTKEFI